MREETTSLSEDISWVERDPWVARCPVQPNRGRTIGTDHVHYRKQGSPAGKEKQQETRLDPVRELTLCLTFGHRLGNKGIR